jgi:hypothetical protein
MSQSVPARLPAGAAAVWFLSFSETECAGSAAAESMSADLASPWAGGAIFALTWVLMATRLPFLPIGRTAGTLAGAALTVAANPALSGTAAFNAISLESALSGLVQNQCYIFLPIPIIFHIA